jgi:hypothetical protein
MQCKVQHVFINTGVYSMPASSDIVTIRKDERWLILTFNIKSAVKTEQR